MKNHAWRNILTILSTIFLIVGTAATLIEGSPAKAQAAQTAPATGANQDGDSLVAAAKKEGMVVMYSAALTSQVRVALTQAFKAKYGINLEVSPFSRTSEFMAKLQAEQRAGVMMFLQRGLTRDLSVSPAKRFSRNRKKLLLG